MLRSVVAFPIAAAATAIGIVVQWFALRFGWPVRRLVPMYYHRLCLRLLGVRVTVQGEPVRERPLLLVSNHCSWLDILVLSSVTPVMFIAKAEIARWPLIGLFARLQRTVFVDRSRRHATSEVNRQIAARMNSGDPVVLFGEGTSGDGNRVLPFRSALFGALDDGLENGTLGHVQPVSIAYTRLHGVPMGRHRRPHAAWYGDVSLMTHLLQVLRQGATDVVVSFGPAVVVERSFDRKALAQTAHLSVRRMTSAALAGRALERV